MKIETKNTIAYWVILGCLLVSVWINVAIAADSVSLTLSIPAAKVQVALAQFLAERPNTIMMDDPAADPNEFPLPQIQKYTDKQHVKNELLRWFHRECKAGKKKLLLKAAEDDGVLME